MRRNTIIRIASLITALAMILTMAVPAWADTGENVSEQPDVTAVKTLTSKDVKAIKPTGVKAVSYNTSKIKVTWSAIDSMDGYEIYRATSKNGTYTRAITKGADATSYINTNRAAGKTYYYKMRAYKEIDGKKVYTKYSNITYTHARPSKVKNVEITSQKNNFWDELVFTWDKVSGATGYQLYAREQGTDEWEWWGNHTKTTARITDLPLRVPEKGVHFFDPEKLYDFKIKAYKTVGGKKVYGADSDVTNYEFEWDEESLKEWFYDWWEGNGGTRDLEMEARVTPENATNFSALWPEVYSYYEPFESVKAEILEKVIANLKGLACANDTRGTLDVSEEEAIAFIAKTGAWMLYAEPCPTHYERGEYVTNLAQKYAARVCFQAG